MFSCGLAGIRSVIVWCSFVTLTGSIASQLSCWPSFGIAACLPVACCALACGVGNPCLDELSILISHASLVLVLFIVSASCSAVTSRQSSMTLVVMLRIHRALIECTLLCCPLLPFDAACACTTFGQHFSPHILTRRFSERAIFTTKSRPRLPHVFRPSTVSGRTSHNPGVV